MSILEKINEAENKAESLKVEAKAEVSKLLEKNNIDNDFAVKQKFEKAHQIIEDENKKTLEKIKLMQEKLNEECLQLNNKYRASAKVNLEGAVSFIMKKVIDS